MKHFLKALHTVLKYTNSMHLPQDPLDEAGHLAFADYAEEHGLKPQADRLRWYAGLLQHLRHHAHESTEPLYPNAHREQYNKLPAWVKDVAALTYGHREIPTLSETQQQDLHNVRKEILGLQPRGTNNKASYQLPEGSWEEAVEQLRRQHREDYGSDSYHQTTTHKFSDIPIHTVRQYAFTHATNPNALHNEYDHLRHVYNYAEQNPPPNVDDKDLPPNTNNI